MKPLFILIAILFLSTFVSADQIITIDSEDTFLPASEQVLVFSFTDFVPVDLYLEIKTIDGEKSWVSTSEMDKVSNVVYTYNLEVPNNIEQGRYIILISAVNSDMKHLESSKVITIEGKQKHNPFKDLGLMLDYFMDKITASIMEMFKR